MHIPTLILPLLSLLPSTLAAINGHCQANRQPGVCVTTTDCSASGGRTVDGACPNDPANVKCCYKLACQGSASSCRWTPSGNSACSGATAAGLCPGPSAFSCCLQSNTWARPAVPTNRCQSHVINAGNRITAQFPGHVNVIGCYGERAGASDHPKGLALDLMVGTYNPAGFTVAEWIMNNCASLRCTYVIWGQRIWSTSVDGSPKSWENWRRMEDRGSITANHWDHPHVSFAA